MSLPIDVLLGAEIDLQEAYNAYEEQREGLGHEFATAVEAYLDRISNFPQIAPVFIDNIRRQVIARFPYGIFYEPLPTRIALSAVLNLRQSDAQIMRRLRAGRK